MSALLGLVDAAGAGLVTAAVAVAVHERRAAALRARLATATARERVLRTALGAERRERQRLEAIVATERDQRTRDDAITVAADALDHLGERSSAEAVRSLLARGPDGQVLREPPTGPVATVLHFPHAPDTTRRPS